MYGHWYCDFNIDVKTCVAFLYEMVDESGKCYIGVKKFFKGVDSVPIPEGAKESNWKTYTSSSKPVNRALCKGVRFSFRILQTFECFSDALAGEREALLAAGVPHNDGYYNISAGYLKPQDVLDWTRLAVSRAAGQNWKDPGYRKKNNGGHEGQALLAKREKRSPETVKKIRQVLKALWADPEFYTKHVDRGRARQWWNGLTPEQMEYYRDLHREHSKNIPCFQKGHTLSQETLTKMSLAKKGKPLSEGQKAKISKALKGIKRGKEYCQKMSEVQRGVKRRLVESVTVRGETFKSFRQAANSLGENADALKEKCESDSFPDYLVVFKKPTKKVKRKHSREVSIRAVVYPSISAAARITGESRNDISRKAKSNDFTEYTEL